MAWVVGVISVGPPLGVDPGGKMRLRTSNKQTNNVCFNQYIVILNLFFSF